MNAPVWPPRPLSPDERTVLEVLLSADFAGAADLRRQAAGAQSVGGCACGCPSVRLLVADPAVTRAQKSYREVPAELEIEPDADGIPGAVMLFVRDGLLDYLEYVYYTDVVPTRWPDPGRLSVQPRRP